ncbi:MAG TPA: hypothetical protein IAD24_01280 [Candidatus Aphodomorpha intestinavium]|uniref:RNA polymerase sigma-70 region 2 domain-containing protein n=1 Tax=Candidatus Aphodomorpha intestinavium TaxID=2840672 RepID=A0A9D1N260_9FIRM|nr:hypothetical protein [Candidatus Aphodomorpha intestinavium]
MISPSLQERIHRGDRDAFRALYSEYSRDVYLTAQEALQSDALARAVVRQVFLRIHRELLAAAAPLDTDARIDALTNEEIRVQRIASGDTGEAILRDAPTPRRVTRYRECAHAAQPAQPEADALARVRARYAPMQQPPVPPAGEPLLPQARPRMGAARVAAAVLVALFLLVFLWALAGILMSLGVLPAADLGYGWFDRVVFRLFGLPA